MKIKEEQSLALPGSAGLYGMYIFLIEMQSLLIAYLWVWVTVSMEKVRYS